MTPVMTTVLNCEMTVIVEQWKTEACILVIHGCLVVLGRLLMVLWVLVGLLLVVREGVDPHEAVIARPLRVSHGSGGEMGRRQHDWGLHALLPHFAAAALLCTGKNSVCLKQPCTCLFLRHFKTVSNAKLHSPFWGNVGIELKSCSPSMFMHLALLNRNQVEKAKTVVFSPLPPNELDAHVCYYSDKGHHIYSVLTVCLA